jgi:hypothetical protein
MCIIDPCSGEYGSTSTFSATCNAGECELVVDSGSGGSGSGGGGGAAAANGGGGAGGS